MCVQSRREEMEGKDQPGQNVVGRAATSARGEAAQRRWLRGPAKVNG